MKITYNQGIVVSTNTTKILLDPETSKTPIGCPTLITHAHSDHTAGLAGSSKSYCTSQTNSLYETCFNKKGMNITPLDFHETITIGDLEIEFIPAGHLFGAAQIIIQNGKKTLYYTGDFCPEPLLSVPGAELPTCEIDVMITEATYGAPFLHFEDRSSTRMSILNFCLQKLHSGIIPVLNVSQLGGAQELITLFNKYTQQVKIWVDQKIQNACEVYNLYGYSLNFHSLDDMNSDSMGIVLISRSTKNLPLQLANAKTVRGIISGQVAKFAFATFEFTASLSTHASYPELVANITHLRPRKVFTQYTYAEVLAKDLKQKLMINITPIKELKNSYYEVTKDSNMLLDSFF